jgi:FixJ family two-component response regulator
MQPELFTSPKDFLRLAAPAPGACLVADIRLGDSSGLELPLLLNERHWHLPVIFLTAQDTDAIRTAAKQVGASALFCKPVDDRALIDAIEWAVENHG